MSRPAVAFVGEPDEFAMRVAACIAAPVVQVKSFSDLESPSSEIREWRLDQHTGTFSKFGGVFTRPFRPHGRTERYWAEWTAYFGAELSRHPNVVNAPAHGMWSGFAPTMFHLVEILSQQEFAALGLPRPASDFFARAWQLHLRRPHQSWPYAIRAELYGDSSASLVRIPVFDERPYASEDVPEHVLEDALRVARLGEMRLCEIGLLLFQDGKYCLSYVSPQPIAEGLHHDSRDQLIRAVAHALVSPAGSVQ